MLQFPVTMRGNELYCNHRKYQGSFFGMHSFRFPQLRNIKRCWPWRKNVLNKSKAFVMDFKGALSRYFSVILHCRNIFLHQWKPTKITMQFCYLRLYHYTETVYCWLSLSMARMEMDWNLKKKIAIFFKFWSLPWKYCQKFIMVYSLSHHSFDMFLLVHLSILGTTKGTR